jgi:hypothetical protein
VIQKGVDHVLHGYHPGQNAQINLISTGGVQVELVNLDKTGTVDFEVRTYDTNWNWHRYTVFVDRNGNTTVVHNSANTIAIKASYIDVNNDGILDLVSDQYGKIRIQLGELADRADGKAYDISGNAGNVAKVLGAVFGKASLANKTYVGIGLSLVDKGMSYSDLAALALNAAGSTTPDQIVTTLWTNVIGSAPSTSDKAPFIQMLASGTKVGDLAVMAADTSFNTTNINLTGLAQTGIEYTPALKPSKIRPHGVNDKTY